MYRLSIVICVYNKYPFTRSCIKDLFQLPDDNQIIIIDNASSDETQSELSKITKSNFVYVRNEINLFHSAACNQGYRASKSENVLFMNNDIRVKSNHNSWTSNIIDNCKSNTLIGPTMGLLDKDFNFVKEANEQLSGNSYIGGWCIAGNKQSWSQIDLGGGEVWNEKYPMYFNDTDIGFRSKKIGLKLNTISLNDVVHFGKISSAQLNINKLYNEGRAVFLKDWKKN
jgi:GT2 family glycosyltransferase